jgi:shikimate kinase
LHEERGEAAMRAAESEALTEVLTAPPPLVAGVAAGTVTIDSDRERLKSDDAVVVWLRARVETLVVRVGSGEGRAFLQPDPEAALRQLAEGRDPLYAEVADVTLDVDDATVDELADRVISAVGDA